jgi:hypothetical protein
MKHWRAALLLVLAGGAGAYLWMKSRPNPSQVAIRLQQDALLGLYQRLPPPDRSKVERFLSARHPDWHQQFETFSSGQRRELTDALQASIQVAIVPELKPVPIVNRKLTSVLFQPALPQAPLLTPDRQSFILRYADSVGRLELKSDAAYSLRGTVFVVAPGLVATNCHVVRAVARPGSTPGAPFVLAAGDLRIDFGDTPAHQEDREYRVVALKPCPREGLDVAFLEVERRSVNGENQLPDPIPLAPSTPAPLAAGQSLNVGEIGYPDLNDPNLVGGTPTQDLFKAYDPKKYAKFYSPGAVTSVRQQAGIDFVFHIVATWPGESGSPLVDAGGQSVVAIDSCCDRSNGPLPPPSDLSRASRLLVSSANLAIGSWSVIRDAVLGVMLPKGLGGVRD